MSQKKKRTVDKSVPKGPVDLDLTEIHKKIVCMGYPATGVEALYRNHYDDSLRYLDHKYGDNYMVYNLCGEEAYQYSPDRFHGRVRCFPFLDHQACPLALMSAFVKDAKEWIAGAPEHVVVIHCKAGKGRTGIMACCLLLEIEPSLCGSAAAAMDYYDKSRTKDGRGLTVPSQRRSVAYYERLRNEFGSEEPAVIPAITIREICLYGFAPKAASVHWLCLFNGSKTVAVNLKEAGKNGLLVKSSSSSSLSDKLAKGGVQEDMVVLNCRTDTRFAGFCGDLKLVIKDGNGTSGILSINTLFICAQYDSSDFDRLNKRFGSRHPCGILFDYVVTDATRPLTPLLSYESQTCQDGGVVEMDKGRHLTGH